MSANADVATRAPIRSIVAVLGTLRVVAIGLTVVVCSTGGAVAGGFYVPEIGPRASAMGGAMAAQSADASAIFHNPAGLAGQPGTQVQLSLDLFMPQISFFRRPVVDPNSPTGQELRFGEVDNQSSVLPVPFAGIASDLGTDDAAAGIAVYAPFGAALDYPADGAQRQVVTAIDLRAIYISAAGAYRLSKRFRVGASLNYIVSTLSLAQRNAIPYVNGDPEVFPDPDPTLEGDTLLEGHDSRSFSATLGALYSDPGGTFDVGVSVLTPTTLSFKGRADIRNAAITPLMDDQGNVVQEGGQRQDNISTEIPLPLIVRLGTVVRPTSRAMVAFDLNYQRWSTFNALVIDFENEPELLPTPGVYLYDVTVEQDWHDTFTVRLGGEYRALADQPLFVRAGLLYDQSPIDDNRFALLAPDSDKVGVGGGASYSFTAGQTDVQLEMAFQHVFFRERNVVDSEQTILNKPAASFYDGITRAALDMVVVSTSVRF